MHQPLSVLILFEGPGPESAVSVVSQQYLYQSLQTLQKYNIFSVAIKSNGDRLLTYAPLKYQKAIETKVELRKSGYLFFHELKEELKIDYAFPCIHGYLGETGHISAIFEMMNLPFWGCSMEAHLACFNKIFTKQLAQNVQIPVLPYCFFSYQNFSEHSFNKAFDFFIHRYKISSLIIKPSNQGSSIGIKKFLSQEKKNIYHHALHCLTLSPYVIIEKALNAPRELEVAVFDYENKRSISNPGEVIVPADRIYSYEEKYDTTSKALVIDEAKNVSKALLHKIQEYSVQLSELVNIKDGARVDFFWDNDSKKLFFNEINTIPGMTPISLFPRLIEKTISFPSYLDDCIMSSLSKRTLT